MIVMVMVGVSCGGRGCCMLVVWVGVVGKVSLNGSGVVVL